MNHASQVIGDREIVLSRLYDAPRALVYQAWTDPQRLSAWWGPDGFRTVTHSRDFRPGGKWLFTMHGPDGRDYENEVVYESIVPGERLTYLHGEPGEDAQFHATITFEDRGHQTLVTLHTLFATAAERQAAIEFGAIAGGEQTLARLAALLAAPST